MSDDESELLQTMRTVRMGQKNSNGPLKRHLCVLSGDSTSHHAFPEQGTLTIGRSSSNDVVVDDESISRHHATIHIGPPLAIEDLGSSNGSIVGETRLSPNKPTLLSLNEMVLLGDVTIFIQQKGQLFDDSPVDASLNKSESDVVASDGDRILSDPKMKKLYLLAKRIAKGPISVLLLGETGAGKEILAEHIHNESPRADKKFVRLNCAALTPTLLESELFGYEKGAFTGAVKSKPGLLEDAPGGTVFLDEIGEMPMDAQIKLLRVMEERKVRRVGGMESREIDVRFVAATHKDLERQIELGHFREDFYYRIAGVTLSIPPLRERPSEIIPLMSLFMKRVCLTMKLPVPGIDANAHNALQSYSWPGNIRELRNIAERAVLLCDEGKIGLLHLPIDKMARSNRAMVQQVTGLAGEQNILSQDNVDNVERSKILRALEQAAGNQTAAAKILGISRRTLGTRMDTYDIPRPRKTK